MPAGTRLKVVRIGRDFAKCGLAPWGFSGGAKFSARLGQCERQSQRVEPTERSVPSTPARQHVMRHHYLVVGDIHEAVIRGDLAAVRGPAERLRAILVVPDVPARLRPFLTTMTYAARRTAEATTLAVAATETTTLIAQCAGCHQAAGVRPAVVTRITPDVGGGFGHMLDHQRATDALLQGLLLPSSSEWDRGAALLKTATLHPRELPPDPRSSQELQRIETGVHAMAVQAAAARTPAQRNAAYAQVMATCAQCHGLHPRVWVPRASDR